MLVERAKENVKHILKVSKEENLKSVVGQDNKC
jgi:hypothetical protein